MNFLKIGLLLSALTLFIFACTQTSPSNNANNANRASNQAVVTDATPASVSPSNSGKQIESLTPGESSELASAEETFKTVCAKCHKETGEGGETSINGKKVKVPNFKSERMKKDADEDFIDAITNGIPEDGMPAFKDRLSEQQVKDLVRYIRTNIQGQ
jgi:mono/diheme cytochrome c family protein